MAPEDLYVRSPAPLVSLGELLPVLWNDLHRR